MKWNADANNNDIVSDINFLADTDDTSYPLEDKARSANRHYYKAVTTIMEASPRWFFDDSNQTDLPIAEFDLVDGQSQYSLPGDYLKIHAVEVKPKNDDWNRLRQTDRFSLLGEQAETITDYRDEKGIPTEYDTEGGSVWLFPPPSSNDVDTTASNKSGRLHVSREVEIFTPTGNDSREPGFAETFHRLISYGAVIDYPDISPDLREQYVQFYEQLREEMRTFYANQNTETKTRFDRVDHNQRDFMP